MDSTGVAHAHGSSFRRASVFSCALLTTIVMASVSYLTRPLVPRALRSGYTRVPQYDANLLGDSVLIERDDTPWAPSVTNAIAEVVTHLQLATATARILARALVALRRLLDPQCGSLDLMDAHRGAVVVVSAQLTSCADTFRLPNCVPSTTTQDRVIVTSRPDAATRITRVA